MVVKPPFDMDYLRQRAVECGDCLEWQRAFVHGRYPVVTLRIRDETGQRKQRQFYVRHLVYEIKHKVPAPKGRQHVISTSCENDRCIAPKHVVVKTKAELSQRAKLRGLYGSLEFRARLAAGVRHRRKLSDEAVEDIRTSPETLVKMAAKYGVSRRYAGMVRRGVARVDYSSPFAAARLMGAAA